MPTRDVLSDVEELAARVAELERRLSALEKLDQKSAPLPTSATFPKSESAASPQLEPAQTNPFAAFGTGILGIGGAYLLRAAAESGILLPLFAAALSLVYAASWMVLATLRRTRSRIARLTYAGTGALILFPMLWEVTVRFRLVKPATTALVLVGFAIFAIFLAWAKSAPVTAWMGMLTAIISGLTLMVATRELLPFTCALLAMAAAVEITSSERRWPGLRPIAALAADAAMAIVIIILGNPAAVPSEYHAVPAAILIAVVSALFAIYAAALTFHSIVSGLNITVFEIAQFAAAASLALWSVLRATHGSGPLALGIVCLLAGAASYFVAFGFLARKNLRANFNFYASCALAFAMAGSFLVFSKTPLSICFCVAAILSAALSARRNESALQFHSVAYLCAGAAVAGLFGYIAASVAGASPPGLELLPVLPIVTAALLNVLSAGGIPRVFSERFLRLVPVLLTLYGIAAFAMVLLTTAMRGDVISLPRLSVIRTTVACATALVVTLIGARWQRVELVWIGYVTVGLGSLKLIFEDLRFGSTGTLAISLVTYGVVLIVIPRVVRWGGVRRVTQARSMRS